MTIIQRFALLLSLAAPAAIAAQAPIPAQIASSKSVFISNIGEEDNGISERAYATLYSGLGQWGKYQMADAPGAADLVLEIHYESLFAGESVTNGSNFPPTYVPRFRLIILDRATMVPLWSVTEYPKGKAKTTYEQQCDVAVNLLLDDLKALALGQFPSAAAKPPAAPTKARFSQEKPK